MRGTLDPEPQNSRPDLCVNPAPDLCVNPARHARSGASKAPPGSVHETCVDNSFARGCGVARVGVTMGEFTLALDSRAIRALGRKSRALSRALFRALGRKSRALFRALSRALCSQKNTHTRKTDTKLDHSSNNES